MSIIPQGKSIQAMYRDYRDGNLLVNRKYQRKLVWSIEEKQKLINSILNGYPIPLILLAERPDVYGIGKYEIIDGTQRFNAIFTFIENAFDIEGKFFDVKEFARAKQLAEEGIFIPNKDGSFLAPEECANILDYHLAITIYPTTEDGKITEVFGRINANGRQLSPQEQRQAGVTSLFSTMVRTLSAELRGDVSKDVILLSEMPEISIDSGKKLHGYGVIAEDTIWCKQGIITVKQLKDSEDEQIVADIVASILKEEPLSVSKELLDKLYDSSTSEAKEIASKLTTYGLERLVDEIKGTFSILKNIIEDCSEEPNYLRTVVRPGSRNPIKTPFYAIFMALFELVVKKIKSPYDSNAIINSLNDLSTKLTVSSHYTTTEDRKKNINLTIGLIQDYFVDKVPPVFGHGPALAMDFENSLRRSRIESPRYEFKQGILRLDGTREIDTNLLKRLIETSCAISNLGPDTGGNIFIGVADKEKDAIRIQTLDRITPRKMVSHYVVGIDREAKILNISLDNYVQKILDIFRTSNLGEPLKSQILSSFDIIQIQNFSIIRIVIPPQKKLTFVGEKSFTREGPNTIEISSPKLLAVSELFRN